MADTLQPLSTLTLTQESVLRLLSKPHCSAIFCSGRGASGWWTLSCNGRRVRGSVIGILHGFGLVEVEEDRVARISDLGLKVLQQPRKGRWGGGMYV